MAGLAVRLRDRGAEVRVCAPADEEFATLLAGVGVPLLPVGPSARALTKAAPPPSSLPQRAAEVIAAQLDAVTAVLAPETGKRARVVAGTIRTDRATVAAKLLLDAVSRERPPMSG